MAIGSNVQPRYTAITLQVLDFAAQAVNEIHWRPTGLLAQGEGQYAQWTQLQALTHLFELVQRDACSSTLQLGKERPARICCTAKQDSRHMRFHRACWRSMVRYSLGTSRR